MCCNTKEKIAAAVKSLICRKPIRKITVQDIMEETGMKRQSFYYHFQDIYEVLEWEVDRCLFDYLLEDTSIDNESWILSLLQLIKADRSFYKKTVLAFGRKRAAQKFYSHIRPHAIRMMQSNHVLSDGPFADEEEITIEFVTYTFSNYLIDGILAHNPMDTEEYLKRLAIFCRMAVCSKS